MTNKTSESQLKASKEYRKRVNQDPKKKERNNYLASRRSANSFIRNKATQEDLDELKKLINDREQQLKSNES